VGTDGEGALMTRTARLPGLLGVVLRRAQEQFDMERKIARGMRRLAGIAALVAGCAAAAGAQSGAARPNILLIATDDHAFQAIGAYGSRINRTPSMDRLAREGMLFERAFVTNSICAPSRAVMLTGKYSHVNGQIDNAVTFDGAQPASARAVQPEVALL